MNILVTSASRKVSLIKSFKNSCKKYEKGKIIATDMNSLSPALYHADKHILTIPSNNPNFLNDIIKIPALTASQVLPVFFRKFLLFLVYKVFGSFTPYSLGNSYDSVS